MNLKVVTGNPNKVKEVAAYFGEFVVVHVKLDLPEYRGDDVGEIARGKAKVAYRWESRLSWMIPDFIYGLRTDFPGICDFCSRYHEWKVSLSSWRASPNGALTLRRR